MEESNRSVRGVRFGVFEVDLRSGELRKQGLKIKLQGQAIQILGLLLERPGELVTREELREKLWPADTFVDFEHGLNAAVKKLRAALGDSADNPRFVETLPRRGYRFIPPVEGLGQAPPAQVAPEVPTAPVRRARFQPAWLAALAVVALLAVLLGLNVGGLRDSLLGGTPPGEITSIAVLPLENLMGDPEQEYFVDGMTDALISDLGKIGALRVISRTSTMQYKETRKSLPQIARELNVDAVVEGSVLRAGERVRVTVQLMRAVPEQQLWTQSYERDLSEILALQREVARAVAREIKIALTPEEQARLAIASSVNPGAYESYLRGRYHLATETNDGMELAIKYFQQALEKDPNYALPYAGLAEAYQFVETRGLLPRSVAITRAKAAAEKALEMDPALGEAHTSLALIRYWHDWDWSGAERAFKRAIELNPGNANAHAWYSNYLIFVGRSEEAIAMRKRLVELDPLSPATNAMLGYAYVFARHYDRGIEQCRKALELDPNFAPAHAHLYRAYLAKEMYEEAIAEIQRAVDLSGGWPKHDLAYAYAMAGKRDDARKILHELIEDSKRGVVELSGIARIYAALGETDQAFGWLEKAYEDHEHWLVALKVDPFFDSLRSDPRFQDLVRRMNFPE
ncbi:MAG: winged helix-turn-helix domain-containing protein [Acidobacteria bacterium]|nr:winged helix-turn-helix domain-containing protein [Acidobacteriota bacterium]